jgi:photosystem II stability/assembly factor-like uncharacterized protein
MKKVVTFALALFLLTISPTSGLAQDESPELQSDTFKGLALRGIGPAKMSGRIADIAIHPQDQSTWYIAVGSGGVWKTTNAGTTWTPVFDGESSYSIGSVAIDPNNPEVVWVGTGENVSGRHVGYGDGIYRSLDGGKTWSNMGLGESEHIGTILIDPRDSDVVYVAAEGPLWAAGGERGVFKTTDGGESWDHVLQISENTGVTDLEFDPRDPDVLYAAAYQRRRHIWALLAGGPESGIYKTTDAGSNWRRLANGLPKKDMGRIGLAVSPVDPDVVYATIEATSDEEGFYRSENSGESWEKRNSYISGGTGPHYYQEIYASPHKLDRVYQMNVWIGITEDGGKNFNELGEPYKHSDNHALAFDLNDPDYLLAGSDGGLYQTWDHGKSWSFVANLPLTQFYKMAVDNDYPFYNVVGGTQDNNTQVGPSRTTTDNGIQNSDWYITVPADGYGCQIDPKDPNIIYSEAQYGGLMRYDRKNGELVDIKPQPGRGDPPERWNWDSPILISPHSHTRLYFGSQRLWRSDDRGDSWTPISGDLSRGLNRYELEMMGRVWSVDALYDNGAMSWYGNLTTISESPIQEGLIYVGTDDGLIQVTEDDGQNWRRIDSFPGVPSSSFVNEVKASVHDADTVFAVFDNHKVGDFKPYILKSTDRGKTWSSASGNLPTRHIVWSVVQDHVDADLLFAGTEFGIFFTVDGGQHWVRLEGGVPTIAFRDLEIQRRESDLVGASFGRSFYILDDYSPLRNLSPETLAEDAKLFPVRKTLLYIPSTPLGLREKANLGEGHYMAPNPPYGAVFTYYLKEPLKTSQEVRRDREAEIRSDVPFPGWETIEKEDLEDKPAVILTVTDAQGNVMRRVTGPATKGFHRVAWDLRYPPTTPTEIDPPPLTSLWQRRPVGPMVTPSNYSVSLAKLVNGKLEPMGETQSFEVVLLENSTLPIQDRAQVLAFQKDVAELQRKATSASEAADEALERIQHVKKALLDTPGASPELLEQAREIALGLKGAQKKLSGDPTLRRYREPTTPSILSRVSQIIRGRTTYGPTQTQRQSYQIAVEEMGEASTELDRLIETDLRGLEEAMEQAGAPWTPGRAVPGN